MEKKQENDDYSFMQEQIKKRPINKRKLIKRAFTTGAMAIMFGIIASLVFILLEPLLTKMVSPKEEKVAISLPDPTLPEETNEILPENMVQEQQDLEKKEGDTEPIASSIQKSEIEIEDYQKLYGKLASLAEETKKSMVIVNGSTSEVDWFSNVIEKKSSVSGLLVADNGEDLFIISNYSLISSSTEYDIVFGTGEEVEGTLVGFDKATNIAVFSVPLSSVSSKTIEQIVYANLGNSNIGNREGDVVIAIGDPMGYSASIGYGIITSLSTVVYTPDHNYKLITTDIYGSRNAEGFLINTKGQILGVLNQKYNNSDLSNQISAIGVSELRRVVEDISNGAEKAYLGITMVDITEQAIQNGVPDGVFIRKVEMDSPAMETGIAPGDILTRIGTDFVNTVSAVEVNMRNRKPGDEVILTLLRQSGDEYKEINVKVTLQEKTD